MKRRINNPALGNALRQALGREESKSEASITSEQEKFHHPETDNDSETGSAALGKLYSALEASDLNGSKAIPLLVPFAIAVGRNGLLARTREQEAHVVSSLIHRMGENLLLGTPGQAERSDLVLAMACLSGGKGKSAEIKKSINQILIKAVLSERLPDDFVNSISRNTKERRLLRNAIATDDIARTVRLECARAEEVRRQELARLRAIERAGQEQILDIRQRQIRIREKLLSIDTSPEIIVAPLRTRDLQLVLGWDRAAGVYGEEVTLETVHDRLGNWELTRLYSARSAELAAAEFFKRLGATVRDVSIGQLDPHSSDWKTHDLMVDSQPVDVKNARQSFSDPSRYSEYLVPAFKQERSGGNDVSIVAVLSRYMTAAQIRDEMNAECTILGEVKQKELDVLAHWVNSSFSGVLAAANFRSGGRLPGWCFEYKWKKKEPTNEVQQEIIDLARRVRQSSLSLDDVELSRMFFAFVDDRELIGTWLEDGKDMPTAEQEARLWESISALRKSIGWSRRSLFLFVIGYTLMQIKADVERWTPSRFGEWFFIDKTARAKYWPLGLYDPLGYVSGIIRAMEVLWVSSRKLLKSFVSFRLASPWILLGTDSAGNEVTIMAYCGGWIQIDKSRGTKCGLSPLVLGIDQTCPHCKRLICHECDFCFDGCSRMVGNAATARNRR